ncbi:PREDICTED: protein AKNAD1 [Ceratotherium simum simum]|uniref:Protein AKNAD1 n=1 Tax=Ceratotherium simum simum TaxID=73337 RepID=A0ABM1C7P8_CERSS|nr:PREDICTED: protein AKNAD1 [Ceratotherium simum simum]
MDEADFSEDTTSKQQEDLPYDGDFSQVKIYNDSNFTSKNEFLYVSNQIILTKDDPQEKATHKETCRNADMAMTLDKMTEDAVNKNYDEEKQCTINLPILADNRDPAKSKISGMLLHHLSKEEFLKGQGINCETLPEISNADSFDEAILKNIILQYVKNSWPKEQTPELTDQLNPQRDGENSNKPSCSPTTTEENISDLEELTGDSSHQENSNFLTKIKSPSDKQKSCHGQTSQKQQPEKASSGSGFKRGQSLVHYLLSDFSKVAPKVKIPKNSITDKTLTIDKQANFSPTWRYKSAIVQDILENMSRSNVVEKQEQKMKTTKVSQLIEMEPTIHVHQEHLTGLESETSLLKLSSTSQKEPSSSSSYIFQKISQGKQMCQKLKEQTDQLKTKVQEFSKSIAQDSPYHLQDRRLVLENLQGHLELLEQEFLAKKEKRLTLKQQVHKHEPRVVGDFDPDRKVEGEIFKLEMLLEYVKEKIDKGKYTSALSLPMSSPIIQSSHELASASSPSSNEEDPSNASGRQEHAEITSPSCAFCRRVLEWKQKMEKNSHRRINCGRFPSAIQEKALHPDSVLCSDAGHSCYSASATGAQSNKCEACGTKSRDSGRVCGKEPPKEFHYRHNTPGQNYLNHSERSAFVPLCFLNENKNSSLSCSKPNWICSQRASSKSSQDEHEPIAGKISGSKSSSNFSSIEEMESEILNSSLDHALRTATILKETTDQMIRTIAADLAKIQRWRNQLKY